MSLVEWDKSYSVDIEKIDIQHKKLIGHINSTALALSEEKMEKIFEVIDGLRAYVIEHFGVEEKFFKQSHYPKTAEHIARHKLFVDRIEYFNSNLKKDFKQTATEMVEYMSGWIIGHILTYDKEYVPHWKKYYHEETGIKNSEIDKDSSSAS